MSQDCAGPGPVLEIQPRLTPSSAELALERWQRGEIRRLEQRFTGPTTVYPGLACGQSFRLKRFSACHCTRLVLRSSLKGHPVCSSRSVAQGLHLHTPKQT
jgi:hypothetical protein